MTWLRGVSSLKVIGLSRQGGGGTRPRPPHLCWGLAPGLVVCGVFALQPEVTCLWAMQAVSHGAEELSSEAKQTTGGPLSQCFKTAACACPHPALAGFPQGMASSGHLCTFQLLSKYPGDVSPPGWKSNRRHKSLFAEQSSSPAATGVPIRPFREEVLQCSWETGCCTSKSATPAAS